MLARRKAEFERVTGAVLPVSPEATPVALDKWLSMQALARAGVPVPDTVLGTDAGQVAAFVQHHDFPLIVKPRRGWGGQGLTVVRTDAELARCLSAGQELVVQEYLEPADREYTVGVVLNARSEPLGALPLQRWLSGGLSYRMVSDLNREAAETAARAASSLGLIGPANVQLRITPEGPRVFEVNPRCSSSTCIRAEFGLNEPELAIRSLVLGEEVRPPHCREGICLRFWEEIYLPASAKEAALCGRYPWRGRIRRRF